MPALRHVGAYLDHGDVSEPNVFVYYLSRRLCFCPDLLFVCLSVSRFTVKVVDEFLGSFRKTQETIGFILGVMWNLVL